MAKRLTVKMVEGFRKKPRHYVVWDRTTVGLGIKITPRGKRIWCLQLRYPGHKVQTVRTLGRFPDLGLGAARAKAEQWYNWVKKDIDPEEAEGEERAKIEAAKKELAEKKAKTFASVAELYIAEHVEGKPRRADHLARTSAAPITSPEPAPRRSPRQNQRRAKKARRYRRAALPQPQRRAKATAREIRNDLVREWGDKPINSITPDDVKALVEKIKARAPYEARSAFSHARTLFQWAVHNKHVQASPVASLKQIWLLGRGTIAPRQRTLDDEEVAAFWRGAVRMGYPYGPLFQMLVLTGCRLNEVAQARWSEFHGELRRAIRDAKTKETRVDWTAVPDSAKRWVIPAERFKSKRQHIVPLPNDACAILETLPLLAGCDFLFTANGKKPINGLSKGKNRLDDRMLRTLRAMARHRGEDPAQVRLKPWKNHDLRRVVRTNLAALDVQDHIAELVLGHARKDLQAIYDEHHYEPQIRKALERWAARLREIVKPAPPLPPSAAANNIITLKRRAGR